MHMYSHQKSLTIACSNLQSMIQGTFQKRLLGLLLFAIAIYGLSRVFHQNGAQQLYFLNQQVLYSDKQQTVEAKHNDQQQDLSTADMKHSDETKQDLSPTNVGNAKVTYKQQPNSQSLVNELDQHLVHMAKDDTASKHAGTLSPSQAEEMKHSNKMQQSLPPVEVSNTNNQQQPFTPSVVPEIDQRLLGMVKNGTFSKYIDNATSSQLKDITTQIVGANNLTSDGAQKQFLKCTGSLTLRKLYGKHPKSPIEFPSYQHCKKMSFKSSGPLVSLSSVPGSGNSWVRQLVESATGIYTGAVYCDPSYVAVGMIGEGMYTNNVILVKIHVWPGYVKMYLNNDKAIYVVRSPFRAILSENNRNIARISKKYLSQGDSHVMEVDFNYSTYISLPWLMLHT